MQRQHVSTESSNTRERREVSIPLPEIHIRMRSERERYTFSTQIPHWSPLEAISQVSREMLGNALWKLIYAVSPCDETARRSASQWSYLSKS